ncbi:MAG TPA: hypothetical protein VFY95_05525 [Sphingomicrobium sp.]
MARKKGAEYVGRFKEVDGYLVIDEDSWREVEGDSYIGEDDAVENTRMGSAIEAEYRSLRLQRGWTFMGTSDRTLREARVAFVGLNPGGGGPNDNYDYSGIWAVETGNGYFDERWGPNGTQTTIQKQVQQWHKIIGVGPYQSFCANFVPFRSQNWISLVPKTEVLAFAKRLWAWVLDESPASLFVTMGKRPAHHLADLLEAKHVAQFPTGWGRQTIDVWDAPDGRRVVGMPHPSRYALFCRSGDASEIAEASLRAATGPIRECLGN